MKVEPLRTGNSGKQNSLEEDIAIQQNNWLQNEIINTTSLRSSQSIRSGHLGSALIRTQPTAVQTPPIIIQKQPTVPPPELTPPINCPPGLEYLATVDQLLVQQKVELVEAITGFETNNKFNVKNTLGQKVYWAAENNDCCTRNCCGPLRRFKMQVFDAYQNEVMHLRRPAACDSCFFPCCLQSIEVSAPPGRYIGSVQQKWSVCHPYFSIKDLHGDTILRIEGPLCTWSICGNDVEFKILNMNGVEIGKISKQWSGLARELFTDADFFGISFPIDLDVNIKAIMLGACFLIDAMFFEKSDHRENDRPGMF
ncbi:phospholipid scramblase 2-like [Sitodiplosis mosellana]|uniref:phospholipid scramblase 2-like n=1 Tax=Sitodiplosis mosellana TaxID=263140 RepID=UPI0024451A1A|nr:phospholipid scramblase 2-like [Sitodiplosis mosellana]